MFYSVLRKMKKISIVLIALIAIFQGYAQNKLLKDVEVQNPILSGFYPDPSICRVGEDYYIVNSSFEYFPGLPIFHSKDLAHWQQIGYALNTPEQLNLDSTIVSGGLYAPTLRYINGMYYIVNTLYGKKNGQSGNFIIHANQPGGHWSDPVWIKNAPGIDPSLFQDDDGKVYYTGNRRPENIPASSTLREIWLQELDMHTLQLIGEPKVILVEGALHGAHNVEGPHIYKKDGYYYLITAEGGTGFNHAVTVFRSKKIDGPYLGNLKNPILTHRYLGQQFPVTSIGHADLVQTQNGSWWMVVLGVRPYEKTYFNIGRETFIVPVTWEDGWPVANPGYGSVQHTYMVANLPEFSVKSIPDTDNFDSDTLSLPWNFIRTPKQKFWSLTENKGHLRIHLLPESITGMGSPAFVGRRQTDTCCFAATKMTFIPKADNERAGMVLYQNNDQQFRVEKCRKSGKTYLQVVERDYNPKAETILFSRECNDPTVIIGTSFDGENYDFKLRLSNGTWETIVKNVSGKTLSTRPYTYTGTYIGMYGTSNGQSSRNFADFDWFLYKKM